MLGVGAAATLAAWNDAEHGTATFTAGTFGIIGSTDGTTFAEHPTADGAAVLPFVVASGGMTPGTTTYALFSVRTTGPSAAGSALVSADSGNGSGLGVHLTYGIRAVFGTTCDAAAFGAGTSIVAAGSPLTTGAVSAQALQANGASTVHYCFAVTLPSTAPNEAQGQTLTARWEIVGKSS